jgi:uncharacterized iron-regulated membrane protein
MTQHIYTEFEKILASPVKTIIFATGNLAASVTSWLALGTTLLGFIGALCTAFFGIMGVVSWIKKYKAEKTKLENKKRRRTDLD